MRRFYLVMLSVALLGCSVSAEAKPRDGARKLPPEAAAVIQQILRASQQREFARLRALMIQEFIFGFVDPADADAAIKMFREYPNELRKLAAVLRQGCVVDGPSEVGCPGKGGMSPRAGLTLTPDGWRLSFFVEGD